MTGTPYSAGGIRTTVAATRAASDEQLAANLARLVDEMRRAGHHHRRGQERLRPDRARRGPQPGPRPAGHRGDHLPRRARRAPEYADDPAAYVDLVTGPMLDACAPHAKWIDVFCESRRLRRGPGEGDPRGRQGQRPRPGCTPTSSAPARASASPASSAWSRSTTAPTSPTRTSTPWRPAGRRRRCCRAWSSPPGRRTPTAAGCSTRASRWRSPPTATRAPATPPRCRCASRSRSARWGCRRPRRSAAATRAAPGPGAHRRRPPRRGRPRRPRGARRPVVPPPRLPSRCPAGPPDLRRRPPHLAGRGTAAAKRAASARPRRRSSGPPSTRKANGTLASHSCAYIAGLLVLPTSTQPSPGGSSRPMGGRIHGATSVSGASNTTRVGNSHPAPRFSSSDGHRVEVRRAARRRARSAATARTRSIR